MVFSAAVISILIGASAPNADAVRAAAERAAAELSRAFAALPDRGTTRVVACPDLGEGAGAAGAGRVAAEVVAIRFGAATGVNVIDRAKLEALLGEQRLQAMLGQGSGAPDPDLLKRSGAQAMIQGRVEEVAGKLGVTLRLVAAGGRTLASASSGEAPTAAASSAHVPLPPPPARAAGGESSRIEVAMLKLADGLASGFGRLPGSSRYRRLAVLTFSEVGEESKKRHMGTIVTAEIATDLRRDNGLLLVERTKLNEVLGELKVQQMTAVDAGQAGKIGQLADAQALVIGSVADAGDRFLVNARIVATSSGETLAAESVSVPASGMVALASDAVVLRSKSGAALRSVVPGLGQFYNHQDAKAWVFIGAQATLFGAALGFHLAGQSAYSQYQSQTTRDQLGGSPSQAATDLYDTASARYTTRNWLLAAGAAVWVAGIVDAYISGVDGETLLGGGAPVASGATPRELWLTPLPAPDGRGAGLALVGRF
jgi:TolB-like protein